MTHADRDRSEEPTRDERVERYAEALRYSRLLTRREKAKAVAALADAELAEKDATIARLEAEVKRLDHRAAMNRENWVLWRARTEKAEAALARVEALASFGPVYEGESESEPYSVLLEDLRKALRGGA